MSLGAFFYCFAAAILLIAGFDLADFKSINVWMVAAGLVLLGKAFSGIIVPIGNVRKAE